MSTKIKTFIRELSGDDNKYVLSVLRAHPEWYGETIIEDVIHCHFYGVYNENDFIIGFFCFAYWHDAQECVLACVYVRPKYRKLGIFNKIIAFYKTKNSNVPLLTIGAMANNKLANKIYNKKFIYSHYDEETDGNWYVIRDNR